MTLDENNISILIAEDDPDDRLLIREAVFESKIDSLLYFVDNGEEVLEFLCRQGKFAEFADDPMPALIILDLNMPRVDGREVLETLNSHPKFKYIPVVVLTTSSDELDMNHCYEFGANAFIVKPLSIERLSEVMKTTMEFWLNVISQSKQRAAC